MTRALVLGGGGPVGIGWETGLLAGLARGGVQMAEADSIIGTSAGSAVGALLALGANLDERLEGYRTAETEAAGGERDPAARSPRAQGSADRLVRLMTVLAEAAANDDEVAGRASIGRFALEVDALPEERFVAGFEYLRAERWPARFACTAVEAETGAFVVWDVSSDVPVDRAVASSCAVPGFFAPITIEGRRYIDGGMRSATNADMARGHDLVVLVSMLSPARMAAARSDPRAARYAVRLESEMNALSEGGSRVEVLAPDDQAAAAMGRNVMDPAGAPAAAAEGLRQGQLMAEQIGPIWAQTGQ